MPTWANERRQLKRAFEVTRTFVIAAGRAARAPSARPLVTAIGVALLAVLLLVLYVKTQDLGGKQQAELLGELARARVIDARWDAVLLEARNGAAPAARAAIERDDLAQIYAALDGAARALPTRAAYAGISDLKNAYAEKAELTARFMQANADARQALAAAMRADAGVSALVRAAWREYPQRDRLVAAENLVARVLAEAQAYSIIPTADHQANLQAYAADLSAAHSLPRGVQSGLSRLESDIHQLLLIKPLEHAMWERLSALATAPRVDELGAILQRRQIDDTAARARYRVYFLLYALALLVAAAYAAIRLIDRYRALETRLAETEIELREARRVRDSEEASDATIIDAGDTPVDIRVHPFRRR